MRIVWFSTGSHFVLINRLTRAQTEFHGQTNPKPVWENTDMHHGSLWRNFKSSGSSSSFSLKIKSNRISKFFLLFTTNNSYSSKLDYRRPKHLLDWKFLSLKMMEPWVVVVIEFQFHVCFMWLQINLQLYTFVTPLVIYMKFSGLFSLQALFCLLAGANKVTS